MNFSYVLHSSSGKERRREEEEKKRRRRRVQEKQKTRKHLYWNQKEKKILRRKKRRKGVTKQRCQVVGFLSYVCLQIATFGSLTIGKTLVIGNWLSMQGSGAIFKPGLNYRWASFPRPGNPAGKISSGCDTGREGGRRSGRRQQQQQKRKKKEPPWHPCQKEAF